MSTRCPSARLLPSSIARARRRVLLTWPARTSTLSSRPCLSADRGQPGPWHAAGPFWEQAMKPDTTRRQFLKHSTTALAAGTLAAQFTRHAAVHAAGSDVLRVGLIGCGRRGTG